MVIPADLYGLGREALLLAVLVSAPFLGGALLSGVLTGALQSFTRLQEPAVSQVARVASVLLIALVLSPVLAGHVLSFATTAWSVIQDVSR